MDPPPSQILIFDIWDGKLGCLTGEILCEIESLPNIEILFNILVLPNIAKVRTYYSAWSVCGPSSVVVVVVFLDVSIVVVFIVVVFVVEPIHNLRNFG